MAELEANSRLLDAQPTRQLSSPQSSRSDGGTMRGAMTGRSAQDSITQGAASSTGRRGNATAALFSSDDLDAERFRLEKQRQREITLLNELRNKLSRARASLLARQERMASYTRTVRY